MNTLKDSQKTVLLLPTTRDRRRVLLRRQIEVKTGGLEAISVKVPEHSNVDFVSDNLAFGLRKSLQLDEAQCSAEIHIEKHNKLEQILYVFSATTSCKEAPRDMLLAQPVEIRTRCLPYHYHYWLSPVVSGRKIRMVLDTDFFTPCVKKFEFI